MVTTEDIDRALEVEHHGGIDVNPQLEQLDAAIRLAEDDVGEDVVKEFEEEWLETQERIAKTQVTSFRVLIREKKAIDAVDSNPLIHLQRLPTDAERDELNRLKTENQKNIQAVLNIAAEREARADAVRKYGYDAHYNNEPPWWPGKSLGRKCPEHLKR